MRRVKAERAVLAAKNRAEGNAFLAANKKRPGVVTLPSGLQYEVLRPGDGPKPAPDDTIKVHFRGTLVDGTVFDSSLSRRGSAVIRGRRHPGLERGAAHDARGLQVEALRAGGSGLR